MNHEDLKNILNNGGSYELECAIESYLQLNRESKFKNNNQFLLFKKLEEDFNSLTFDTRVYLKDYLDGMAYHDYKFL
jgi:hypothetical protein